MMHRDETTQEAELPVDKSGRVFLVWFRSAAASRGPDGRGDARRLAQPATVPQPRPRHHRRPIGLVRRFIAHTNEFPWSWTPAMVEEFFADLRGIKGRGQSTIRGYQNGLRLFCSYIADPDYGWDRVCEQRFGTHPAQVFFACNTATHVQDNEQNRRNGRSPNRSCRTSSTTPTTRSP